MIQCKMPSLWLLDSATHSLRAGINMLICVFLSVHVHGPHWFHMNFTFKGYLFVARSIFSFTIYWMTVSHVENILSFFFIDIERMHRAKWPSCEMAWKGIILRWAMTVQFKSLNLLILKKVIHKGYTFYDIVL